MDGGDRLTQAFAALLLCGVAYVAVRTLLAERSGEDPRQAARGAFRVLAPGLFVGAIVLFVLLVLGAVVTVVLVLALLGFITGENSYDVAGLAVLLGGAVFLVVTVAGALRWGVRRMRSSRPTG